MLILRDDPIVKQRLSETRAVVNRTELDVDIWEDLIATKFNDSRFAPHHDVSHIIGNVDPANAWGISRLPYELRREAEDILILFAHVYAAWKENGKGERHAFGQAILEARGGFEHGAHERRRYIPLGERVMSSRGYRCWILFDLCAFGTPHRVDHLCRFALKLASDATLCAEPSLMGKHWHALVCGETNARGRSGNIQSGEDEKRTAVHVYQELLFFKDALQREKVNSLRDDGLVGILERHCSLLKDTFEHMTAQAGGSTRDGGGNACNGERKDSDGDCDEVMIVCSSGPRLSRQGAAGSADCRAVRHGR